MGKLEKSQETLAKEAEVVSLEKAIKKTNAKIKSLSTRLVKLKQGIKEMQQKTGSFTMSTMERILWLQKEMGTLVEQLLQHKKILKNPAHRQSAEALQAEFSFFQSGPEADLFEAFEAFQKGELPPEFEPDEARNANIFAEFQAEPDPEEKRDIRKVYLRLSQAFHPDKAANPEEQELFHERMQQITTAYKAHDSQTLLALESQFLADLMPAFDTTDTPTLLDDTISRLTLELDFLTRQSDRLSVEIKAIRQSDLGQALTEYDRGNREGFGLEAESAEMELVFTALQKTAEAIKQALALGKMTPELEAELQPPPDPDEMLADLFGHMAGDFGFWGDDDDDDDEPDAPPRFDYLDKVKYVLREDTDPVEGLTEGAVGQVVATKYSAGEYYYEIAFEASAIDQLEIDTIANWVAERWEHGLVECWESELKAAPRARINLDKSLARGRERLYQYWVGTQVKDTAQGARLKEILLRLPEKTDEENWVLAFASLGPLEASEAEVLPNMYFPKGIRKARINGMTGFDHNEGFMVEYEYKKGKRKKSGLLPLRFVKVPADSPFAQMIGDYQLWAEQRLPISPFFSFFR